MAGALVILGTLAPASATQAASAAIGRLWGPDRYATAASISQGVFAPGVSVAFIATGLNFPDSLAGGPAAALQRAPILLTTPGSLPDATRNELARLAPGRIVILGGTGVVSPTVEAQLAAYTRGGVSRLAGVDRFATAAAISAAHFGPGAPVAFVATGRGFPDALSAGAAAAAQRGPMLLVDTNSIPHAVAAELSRLRPARIVVVGGAAVVADTVLAQLRSYTSGSVTRQWGADRYATAAAVALHAFPQAGTVHIATGLGFADAVAGVPAAAAAGGPLLLSSTASVPRATVAELERLDASRVILLGGTGVLSDGIVPTIAAATHDADALVRAGGHSFRIDPYSLQAVPPEALAFNGASIVEPYGVRDSTGAVLYRHTDGNLYDHPVGQAQYVVNMLRNYRLDPNQTYLDLAIANANRLLARAVRHDGGIFFPYPFDFFLHGRGTMVAPWYSGMAQGIALSGFVRLYQITGDAKWLQAAHDTFASFLVVRQPDKPWVTTVDNGLLWFELYPWVGYDHTYNGHNFGVFGLYDYWRLTGNEDAGRLTVGGITTTARMASIARVPGGTANYCLAQTCLDRQVRNSDYHLVVTGQMVQLFRYTRDEAFARLAELFTADYPNFTFGGSVVFQPGDHVAYQFDTAGVGSPARAANIGATTADYSRRTVPFGWIRPGNGIWMFMTSGTFNGLWIRESAAAYARGFVDRLEFHWDRALSVPSGRWTGYQVDADGVVTATQSADTGATTWHYTARAKINGVSAARLSTGPLAGYWVPVNADASGVAASGAVVASADVASTSSISTFSVSDTPPAPSQPEDPLFPGPLPGQMDLAPSNEPPPEAP